MLRKPITACSFAIVLAISANAPQAQTGNPQPDGLGTPDQQFVAAAMADQLFAINLGVLAQVNGRSEKVQQFGEMVDKDLSDRWPELVAVGKQLGLDRPQEIDATVKPVYLRLSKLSGSRFDKAFSKISVAHYKKILDSYEQETKSNKSLSVFADQCVPMLEKHLQAAELLTAQKHSQR